MARRNSVSSAAPKTVDKPKSLRHDIFMMVLGGVVSLAAAGSVMYWQTERSNAEQRYHKKIESLKEFNIQIARIYDRLENMASKMLEGIDEVDKTYKRRGHAVAEDGERLIALGNAFRDFAADNMSQFTAAEKTLIAYFGKATVEKATPPLEVPVDQVFQNLNNQLQSMRQRVAAARTQEEKNALVPELVETGRSQMNEIMRVVSGERTRIAVLNERLLQAL